MGLDLVGQHPAVVLAVLWMILGAANVAGAPRTAGASPAWRAVSLLLLAGFGATVVYYAARPDYFDPAEPTITAVAWVVRLGAPLYPALDAADRYVHIYGPALFLAHAAALAVLGASISASKAVGAGAIALALVLAYRAFARVSGATRALHATAVLAVLCLAFGNASYWTRAEPLMMLCVALALASADLTRPRVSAVAIGCVLGIAVNLKITGPLYIAPVVVAVAMRERASWLLTAGLVAALAAIAPFLLPQASLANYLDYIRLSAGNGVLALRLRQNLEWSAFLLLPLVVASWPFTRAVRQGTTSRLTLLSLGGAMTLVAIVAAKPGGGPYHLLPFVPVLLHQILLALREYAAPRRLARAALVAAVVTATLVALPRQVTLLRTMAHRNLAPALDEVRTFIDQHPNTRVAVGYAGTSVLSHARVAAVFHSGAYLLDAPAVQEHRLSGLAIPRATLNAMATCSEAYWLVPRGLDAFVVPNAYWPLGPKDVFPDEFRRVFLAHYAPHGHTPSFDVWACRAR